MNLTKNVLQIWKNKGNILEGITNSIFKREDIEDIAQQRMQICTKCELYTVQDEGCMIPKTGPCCNEKMGGCGCSLTFKTRSLSSDCPWNKWKAILTQAEEDLLNEKLGL